MDKIKKDETETVREAMDRILSENGDSAINTLGEMIDLYHLVQGALPSGELDEDCHGCEIGNTVNHVAGIAIIALGAVMAPHLDLKITRGAVTDREIMDMIMECVATDPSFASISMVKIKKPKTKKAKIKKAKPRER